MHVPVLFRTSALLLVISLVLPSHVLAQPPAPRIDSFEIEPARGLTSGNGLAFTLIGTPGATASVSISSIPRRVFLSEIGTGVYEGTYAKRGKERIGAGTAFTARLRLGEVSAILDRPLLAEPSPGAARICSHCDLIEATSLFRASMTGLIDPQH